MSAKEDVGVCTLNTGGETDISRQLGQLVYMEGGHPAPKNQVCSGGGGWHVSPQFLTTV